jgi:hypothetical protein
MNGEEAILAVYTVARSEEGRLFCVHTLVVAVVGVVGGCRHRGPGFDSLRCQIFSVAVVLEGVHSAS